MLEWVALAQSGSWVFIAVAFARGWLVSRSVAERIAAMERQRGDEWKAAAETHQQTIETLRGQRDELLAPVRALLPRESTDERQAA